MKRLAVLSVAVLAACSGNLGQTDGKCAPAIPGNERCIGNKAEVCIESDSPSKDPPEWFVIADCSIPVGPGAYGACVVGSSGLARCEYPDTGGAAGISVSNVAGTWTLSIAGFCDGGTITVPVETASAANGQVLAPMTWACGPYDGAGTIIAFANRAWSVRLDFSSGGTVQGTGVLNGSILSGTLAGLSATDPLQVPTAFTATKL